MIIGSITVLLSFLFFPGGLHFAVQEEKIYTVSEVSVKPEPVKGLNEFHNKWSKKVVYPPDAVKDKIQGMTFVEFIVNKDGSVSDAAVKSGIGHGCDEAALQGFLDVSKEHWKPAIKNGQPVNVKMVIPFAFRIIEN
jgi:protein TonB